MLSCKYKSTKHGEVRVFYNCKPPTLHRTHLEKNLHEWWTTLVHKAASNNNQSRTHVGMNFDTSLLWGFFVTTIM